MFKRALELKRSLGARCAAGYLRNRGVSIEATMWLLCRTEVRDVKS